MRIAIISDLHANAEALFALKEEYDELWVLGDLVNYGPRPREVIQFVRSKASLTIRGNHDNAIGRREDPRCSSRYREMARETSEFTMSILNPADKSWLGDLPLTVTRTVDGMKFVLCHATPADPLFEYAPPGDEWIDRAEAAGADVLLAGHTHIPFVVERGGRIVANPGSLGQPKTGSPEACYAVWNGSGIELKRFSYPVEKTIEQLGALGLSHPVLADLATALRTGGQLTQIERRDRSE